ncbi:MAG: Methylcrotonyl-CoA carboxylase carboxyl transferase subunit, partial [uncultured Nocardioidaceae bacterium]
EHEGARRRAARAARDVPDRRLPGRPGEAHRPRQAARARPGRPPARPREPLPRAEPARRLRHVRRRHPRCRHRHGHRSGGRPGVRGGRQRRHRQGGHLLPVDGEEAPARPGGRPRQQAAVPLPRRLRRRLPAAAGRGLPRPRPLRTDLLQPGHHVRRGHRAGRRGHGLVHGGRRLRAGDVGRDGDRAGPGHDLPGRSAPGEGRDRRGRHRGGARRGRGPRPEVGGRRPPRRGRRARAGHRAVHRGHAAGGRAVLDPRPPSGGRPPPEGGRGGAGGGPRRALRRRADRLPHAVRRARGDPPGRRRQPVPRVQGAVRRVARDRVRAHLGAPGGHRRQQRDPLLRVGAQGGPLHRAVQPAPDADRVPPEHQRLHGRPRLREPGDRPRRRQAGDRGVLLRGAQAHRGHRWLVRRRQLRDVRARVRPALPVDVAQRADLGHGRRAGRVGAGDRAPRRHRRSRRQLDRGGGGRVQGADTRAVRAAGLAVLLHRPAVGRRHHRSGRHPAGPRHGARGRRPRAGTRAVLRHLQDV